jgi:hypothetical protein
MVGHGRTDGDCISSDQATIHGTRGISRGVFIIATSVLHLAADSSADELAKGHAILPGTCRCCRQQGIVDPKPGQSVVHLMSHVALHQTWAQECHALSRGALGQFWAVRRAEV